VTGERVSTTSVDPTAEWQAICDSAQLKLQRTPGVRSAPLVPDEEEK